MLFTKKELNRLIIPLLIEQLLAVAVGMVDIVMISGVGEAAVSGVSLVDNINVLLIGLFSALATGGAVTAGQMLGQKDVKRACVAANQLIFFIGVFAVAVMILVIIGHNFILTRVFGKIDQDVMSAAKTYLLITAISILPLAIYNGCAALFRSMGNSKITMWVSLIMNIIHVMGNTVLIFGFQLGVKGAALSTLFAKTCAATIIMIMIFNKKNLIHLDKNFEFRFQKEIIKKILYIGVPNGLENSIFQLGKILILSLVSACGTYAIAANAVAGNLAVLNVLPGTAIGLAMLSVISRCVGAGDFEQAKYYTRKLMVKIHVYIGAISLVLFIGAPVIVQIYNLSDLASSTTVQLIRWHAIMAFLYWPESFSLPNTLRASNDVTFTMGISILSMWIFRISCCYLLVNVFHMGVLGVWVAMTIDWLFRAIVFVIRYIGGKWKMKYAQ